MIMVVGRDLLLGTLLKIEEESLCNTLKNGIAGIMGYTRMGRRNMAGYSSMSRKDLAGISQ